MLTKAERTMGIQSRHGDTFEAFGDVDPRTPYVVRQKGKRQILSVAIDICISNAGKLCFYDLERGHMLNGKLHKQQRGGAFIWKHVHVGGHAELLAFTPLTMDDFDAQLRQLCTEELSDALQDLDDVCFWYRRQAGIV
jgi:hypothetical protein